MSYTITLVGCKGDEIELIAMCMELCGLDMNSASAVVDHMPSILFENIDEDSANKYKKMLEGVGAILKIDESAVSAPDPFDPFPEPDFGKVLSGVAPQMAQPTVQPAVQPAVQRAPEHVAQPESVAVQPYTSQIQSQPEHIALQPEPEPEQEQEPVKQPQSVIEITPRNKDIVENNHNEETHNTSSSDSKGNSDSSEDTKYEYHGYCPRCGSSFVTVKKVGGLFGSNKVKCVCEACKYKF